MKNYISNKNIGVDSETGLPLELRVKNLNIDAEKRVITIQVDKCLVSPTGVELKVTEVLYYTRYDIESNKKYTTLEESSLGLGIVQMLNLDLDIYPNLQQK